MKRTTARGLAVLGAAVLVAIALAACGGGGSSTTSTTSSTASATNAADTQGPTGATGSAGSALARRTALVACLKKYGVTLPSFGGSALRRDRRERTPLRVRRDRRERAPLPVRRDRRQRASRRLPRRRRRLRQQPEARAGTAEMRRLWRLRRFGATGRAGAFNFSTRIRTELTSFVACMKKHGETLPTPNLSGTGSVFGNVDQTTATFKAAYAQCKGILTYLNRPRRPAGATGSTTS